MFCSAASRMVLRSLKPSSPRLERTLRLSFSTNPLLSSLLFLECLFKSLAYHTPISNSLLTVGTRDNMFHVIPREVCQFFSFGGSSLSVFPESRSSVIVCIELSH